jgi:hypothetical protein
MRTLYQQHRGPSAASRCWTAPSYATLRPPVRCSVRDESVVAVTLARANARAPHSASIGIIPLPCAPVDTHQTTPAGYFGQPRPARARTTQPPHGWTRKLDEVALYRGRRRRTRPHSWRRKPSLTTYVGPSRSSVERIQLLGRSTSAKARPSNTGDQRWGCAVNATAPGGRH